MKSNVQNDKISEEELEVQRKRTQLQDADRKSFYYTSTMAKKRNKEQIDQLRKENKELREQLHSREISTGADTSDPKAVRKLVEKTDKELALWRRRWDDSKDKSQKIKNDLLALQDKLGELKGLGTDQITITSDDNPQMRTIRMLENKLDKAMIKYNEAQSIRKTYEMIVKRLKDERVGYDNQLAAIEQSLKGKEHDFEELLLLSYDAKHAKEVAEAELRKFESQLQAKRELRDKEIQEQQKAVKQRVENKNEEKTKETHEQEIDIKKRELDENRQQKLNDQQKYNDAVEKKKKQIEEYDKSLRKIKDATGASDINEIIQRCVTQKDVFYDQKNPDVAAQHESLKAEREEFEKRLLQLDEEKIELKKKLQKVKVEGIESITKRQINELEK
jgi:coiled-coil domain-containing protein 151